MIIKKDGGVSLAMDISHSRPHRVYDVAPARPFDCFLASVEKVLRGIEAVNLGRDNRIKVGQGDARHLGITDESVDLVITSPPYFNAIDYMRGHKMSLVWMGHRLGDLQAIRSTNIGAEVGLCPDNHEDSVTEAVRKMGSTKGLADRQIGMLRKFAWDMYLVIRETHRVLVRNGEAFFVIGDSRLKGAFIRNSGAIVSLAESAGFEVCTITGRTIPDNRRYLPPPNRMKRDPLGLRMRREVVIGLRKP